ncbi:hypothetical protein [Sansalvadorimonas verongulae]|uniref:hypothetical protein n=1 Tax=Sansalvadorimonas verongulae TaxID=2172824 RepID=UPI0012BD6B92|nr:hypothetical protein [Sansalvadorimonas verongulae]MTI14736.1 hypothetical protein [Sansalvadorimonas verongulae]
MNKHDIIGLLVRATGFWMLALSLQMLPSLLIVLPDILKIILSWEADLDHEPTSRSVGITSKLAVHLMAAFYLIGRGEGLIAWINRRT